MKKPEVKKVVTHFLPNENFSPWMTLKFPHIVGKNDLVGGKLSSFPYEEFFHHIEGKIVFPHNVRNLAHP
jgi:hypothetical protein